MAMDGNVLKNGIMEDGGRCMTALLTSGTRCRLSLSIKKPWVSCSNDIDAQTPQLNYTVSVISVADSESRPSDKASAPSSSYAV